MNHVLNFLRNILPGFVSFLSAIIVAMIGRVLYDRWRDPKLTVYPSKKDPAVVKRITPPCGFYHIVVKNQLKRLGLMVKPVQNARVKMVFLSKSGKEIFRIPAKWDFRPEPVNYTTMTPEPALIPQGELLDINPGSEESFCICIKHKGEDEIYGFNAFSYLYSRWKSPDWKLEKGEYQVRIVLNAANAYDEFHFALKNHGPDFKDVELRRLDP